MKFRVLAAFGWLACLLGSGAPILAQTTQLPVPEGALINTENAARVNGVRIRVEPDGTVWFLESYADSIAKYKDGVITRWQIRAATVASPTGATPVDFQIDGENIYFIETGESLIPPGTCAYARLNTTTGVLTEWVVPGTIPAAFYRAPDGPIPDPTGAKHPTIYLPQSGAVLQTLNMDSLQVLNWRSTATYAYADMVLGPDGALWLADFGDNRIVQWVPGAPTETSWTFYPLSTGVRLNPAQIAFDEHGFLWIAQRSADRMDRFDPATGELLSYGGFSFPIHFELFQGRLYVAAPLGTGSAITVLDPNLAPITQSQILTRDTFDVHSQASAIPVTVQTSTIVPTQFAVAPTPIDPTTFVVNYAVASAIGTITSSWTTVNTYGISVDGGRVWTGTDTALVSLNLNSIGDLSDWSVPVASSLAGAANSKVEVDVTVANRGADTLTGAALYMFSPAAFASRAVFTLGTGATSLLKDAFGNVASATRFVNGPVRLSVSAGGAENLVTTVRSAMVQPSGGSFGYLLPAATGATSLKPGAATTLFTGATDSEVSLLSLYALEDARATLTLSAPDGTPRASRDLTVAKNASYLYNPAADAFGVDPEPGDVVRVGVNIGSLQACVLVYETGTSDIAPSLPGAATTTQIIPFVANLPGAVSTLVSDLFLSNPGTDASADVSVSYYEIGGSGPPAVATLTLAPLASQSILDVLPTLFGIPMGQGALVISSSVPIAASTHLATSGAYGDYGTYANAIDGSSGVAGGQSAYAIGLPQTSTRMGDLLVYNSGAAGAVTVTGFRSDGTQAGQTTVALGQNGAEVLVAVFAALGVTDQAAGRVRVDVPAGMNVFGWAAAIDLVTGDIDISPLE